jgi:DNA repair protein RadD
MFKSLHDWVVDPDWARLRCIRLSATPLVRGLGKHYDDLITAARTKNFIEQRFMTSHPTAADKAACDAKLQWVAQDRGYAGGWVSHKFRVKFGVWPTDPRVRIATPAPPSQKTKQWILSRQIAFARARRSHG